MSHLGGAEPQESPGSDRGRETGQTWPGTAQPRFKVFPLRGHLRGPLRVP